MKSKNFIVFLFAVACNSQQSQKLNKDTIVSLNEPINSSTTIVKDSTEQQINAPDSLFEDGSQPASWRNAGFDDPANFKIFLIQFKGWVKNNNEDSIAAHIQFPLKKIKSSDEFKANYNALFTSQLKDAIQRQRVDRIFRNQNGAMISDGKIWFNEIRGKYFITAINP
ncbi:MAG: hypothetical protein ACR2FN_10600 [Chitinophagaceae bacterium]